MNDFFEKLSGSDELEENYEEPSKTPMEEETEEEGQLAVDAFQSEDEIVIQSTIAGVNPEDLDISIQNDMVTIRGERKKRREEIPEENYFYQECYWGPFSRSIILPEEIKTDESKAELKNGILTLRLPKLKKSKTAKIEVDSAE